MWTHQLDGDQQYLSGSAEAANWREIRDEKGFVVRAGSVMRNGDEYSGVWMREETADLICAAVNACRAINPDNPLAAANALMDAVVALEEAQRFILGAIQSDFRRFDVAADARPELIEKHGTLRVVSEALAALKGGA